MKHSSKRLTAIVSILLFSVGLMLSSSVIAAGGKKATQAALDAAITDLQDQLTELGSPRTYEIGGRGPAGGWVFYVNQYRDHGLEAAPSDLSTGGISWYNDNYTNTEAHGDGIGAGEMNTMLIIANQGSDSNNYAAGLCANYQGGGFGDWYLPSITELEMMLSNLEWPEAGDFVNDRPFWSSTEYNHEQDGREFAWARYRPGNLIPPEFLLNKNSIFPNVRAVRAF